jgi:hypothetical protein
VTKLSENGGSDASVYSVKDAAVIMLITKVTVTVLTTAFTLMINEAVHMYVLYVSYFIP